MFLSMLETDNMALARNISDTEMHFHAFGDVPFKQKCSGSENQVLDSPTGSFECNICLDSAYEPVVTLCGHLYCWPCIYKWLEVETSPETEQIERNCPVCKAHISTASVVPLYGRGSASKSGREKPYSDKAIPKRPSPSPSGPNPTFSSSGIPTSYPTTPLHSNIYHSQQQPFYHQQLLPPNYGGFGTYTAANANGAAVEHLFNPTIGMLSEMVFARMFGRSDTSFCSYSYPNFYTQRMRRQEVQLDKSLNRVSIFLLCCLLLCLILF